MIKRIQGSYDGSRLRVAIVTAKFNDLITSRLTEGALEGLAKCSVKDANITLVSVPGAFEIGIAAERLCASGKVDAVICIGAVIRGDTPHFEQVVGAVTSAVSSTALKHSVPCIFGVLTTDNVEQALNRAGIKCGNKGFEAAIAAVETCTALKQL